MSNQFGAGTSASSEVDNGKSSKVVVKPINIANAVTYHSGAFPPARLDYEAVLGPLEQAAASLARYDAKMSSMANSDLLLAPLQRQDAVSSSRMEGIISTIEEIYRLEAEELGTGAQAVVSHGLARNDAVETLLYARALKNAQEALADGHEISEHLIRTAHQQLMSHGRGALLNPGAYKSEPNFIGDSRNGKIFYVPIAPEHLAPAMGKLVEFIKGNQFRPLIRTAVAHVEFEALHPFKDGNGRVGRMLITLMLWKLGMINKPNFFVSGYFEANKDEYIARMRAVSAANDWTGWVVFFLEAMHEQAKVNTQTADRILDLYGRMREAFRRLLNTSYHDRALDFIFAKPVFRGDDFVDHAGISATVARSIIRKLADGSLLRVVQPAAGRRAALLSFDPLLDLIKI